MVRCIYSRKYGTRTMKQCNINNLHEEYVDHIDKDLCLAWSSWESWTCSVTCGPGTEMRHRTCRYGYDCVGNADESRPCFKQNCPGGYMFKPYN